MESLSCSERLPKNYQFENYRFAVIFNNLHGRTVQTMAFGSSSGFWAPLLDPLALLAAGLDMSSARAWIPCFSRPEAVYTAINFHQGKDHLGTRS